MNDQIAFNAGRAEGRIEGAEILCGIILHTLQNMLDKTEAQLEKKNNWGKTKRAREDEQATLLGGYGALGILKDELGEFFPTIQSMFDDVTKEEQALVEQETHQETPSTEESRLPPDFHG